jgi:hypothetical protein
MPDKEEEQKPKIHWAESPDGIFEVYANMLHITWSLDDVRIRLAQLVTSPKTRDPGDKYVGIAEERAAVSISWRVAKILRDGLSSVIDRYEKTNAEIKLDVKLPPGE